ncbi:MAG: hypothetical protein AB1445_14825 [Bacillota bacterium]
MKAERGATLVEVVAAAAIITLVVTFIFGGFAYGWRYLGTGREILIATSALRSAAEEARAVGPAQLAVGSQVWRGYVAGYDLVRTVSPVAGMVDAEGQPVAKKVALALHRTPVEQNPLPLAAVEFVLYVGGP